MWYVALFRGLNVGGNHRIAMGDLRQCFWELGLKQVQTYIQSGNVLFASDAVKMGLEQTIGHAFQKRFGFASEVILRSKRELGFLIEQLPFSPEQVLQAETADDKVEHLYVYFLDQGPTKEQLEAIMQGYEGPDRMQAGEQELYLLFQKSIRVSNLAARTARVFGNATVRNWKTVNKLYALLAEQENSECGLSI